MKISNGKRKQENGTERKTKKMKKEIIRLNRYNE